MQLIICGMGNTGNHLYEEIKSLNPVYCDLQYAASDEHVYDIAFVCTPADSLPDGSCDTSIIEKIVSIIQAEIYVIKSAVPPRTADMLWSKYGKRIVISPEYYGTAPGTENTVNFVLLGGDKADCAKVAELYSLIKPGSFRILFTSWEAAELTRYMETCFHALKVTFCNEFARIAEAVRVTYPELRELFIQDECVNPSHTWVYPDKPYYDGYCLNAEIPAFITFAKSLGVDPALMVSVDAINRNAKAKMDSAQ